VRLVLYTGKGGVGKTTTAAAAAVCAAERLSALPSSSRSPSGGTGRVLVASADAAHSLGDVLERRLGPDPVEVAPRLDAVEIDARVEAARHWGRIRDYLVSMFVYQGIEATVAEELALLPGAEEITTLLAVEAHARAGTYDLIVLDCAPTGSTLRLATLPDLAHGMVRVVLPVVAALSGVAVPIARRLVEMPLPDSSVFGDLEELLYRNLKNLQQRITDPSTSVRLVVTPERMVIDEARRALTDLSLFDVPCDAVVMNRLLPSEAGEEGFFREWCRLQVDRQREVEELFAPLPVLPALLADDEVTGIERLAAHGRQVFADRDPAALLCDVPRVRFERQGASGIVFVPLHHADPADLDVVKVEDELIITTASRRRAIVLPRRMASLVLAGAQLVAGDLVVRFEPELPAQTAEAT
jgi:arsenite-transporting ATPase